MLSVVVKGSFCYSYKIKCQSLLRLREFRRICMKQNFTSHDSTHTSCLLYRIDYCCCYCWYHRLLPYLIFSREIESTRPVIFIRSSVTTLISVALYFVLILSQMDPVMHRPINQLKSLSISMKVINHDSPREWSNL